MKVTSDTVRALLALQELEVPEDELDNITTRLATWLEAMDAVEAELGPLLNQVDPIPPVFPHEQPEMPAQPERR